MIIDVGNGFSKGISFYYDSQFAGGTFTVYDGVGGTGNVLAEIPLVQAGQSCGGALNCWKDIGITFNGTARSVAFSLTDDIFVDDMNFFSPPAATPLATTTTSLPPGAVNAPYNTPLSATGGTVPYTWTATGLPPGLTVANGAISGIPTTAGTYSVLLTVRDSASPPLSATTPQPLTLIINPIVLSSPLTAHCSPQSDTYSPGAQYSTTCTVSGGTSPYFWTYFFLPPWLRPSGTSGASVTLSGSVPAGPPNSYSVGINVNDSNNQSVPIGVTINLSDLRVSCVPLSGSVTAGASYSATCTASGGAAPYNWSLSNLPSWLKSSATSGAAIRLAGTVPAPPPASYSVGVTLTDSGIPISQTNSTTVTINVLAQTLTVRCNSQSDTYNPGSPYSATCTASGGAAPYTWSFSSLPTWLKSSATAGASITLSGTVPAAPPNSYSVPVTVTDGATATRQTASTTTTIHLATLTISCVPQSGSFTAGASYSATCTASGGTAPYNWSLSNLPSWLKSSATSGAAITLAGTVPAPLPPSYSVTVTLADSSTPTRQTNSTTVTINVPAATLTVGCALASGSYAGGTQYSNTCTASGGTAPYTWSFPSLPSWVKSSGTSGAAITLSGTVPATPLTSYTLTAKASDDSSPKQLASDSLNVFVLSVLQLSCNPTSGPAMVGIPYTATCTASGGSPGYTFSLIGGPLPSGLTPGAGATTYSISGTPAAPGPYNYTVQVRDSTIQIEEAPSAGQTITQSFGGTVSPRPSVGSFSLVAIPSVANQSTVNLTLSSAPPVTLTGKLCLTFSADPSVVGAYLGNQVVFGNGTGDSACSSTFNRTLGFTIPAGSTTAFWDGGNNSQFSLGTVAGTINVTIGSLVDGSGNPVMSGAAQSQKISVPPGASTVLGSATMTLSSDAVTVVFNGVSPKRSLAGAIYTFNPGSSPAITSSVSFTSGAFAGMDQSQWFGTAASLATGGSFSLSVTFPCTNCSVFTGVQVTLSN